MTPSLQSPFPGHSRTFANRIFIVGLLALAMIPLFVGGQEPIGKKKAPPLPEGVEVIRDIEFAKVDGHSLKLDLYRPFDWADYVSTPVVIWVHGGGWNQGSRERCPAIYLAQGNFAVVSIDYRLTDKGQWPDQISDCYAAVRWVRENAGTYGFGEKIGVWGGSAGGHLVALMGTRPFEGEETVSSRIQAVCNFYGPADLLTMPPNVVGDGRTREQVENSNGAKLLGSPVMDVPELARDASALHQVSEDDAPFLIVHGAKDPGVPLEQSRRLHEALEAAGVETELIILPEAGHGGKEFRTEELQAKIRTFFLKHLQ